MHAWRKSHDCHQHLYNQFVSEKGTNATESLCIVLLHFQRQFSLDFMILFTILYILYVHFVHGKRTKHRLTYQHLWMLYENIRISIELTMLKIMKVDKKQCNTQCYRHFKRLWNWVRGIFRSNCVEWYDV